MTAKELEDTLAAIANKARALRDAGVTGTVTIGDVRFDVTGADPAPAVTQAAPEPSNLLDDPDTYGGYIPQRRQPRGVSDGDE